MDSSNHQKPTAQEVAKTYAHWQKVGGAQPAVNIHKDRLLVDRFQELLLGKMPDETAALRGKGLGHWKRHFRFLKKLPGFSMVFRRLKAMKIERERHEKILQLLAETVAALDIRLQELEKQQGKT